MVCVCVGYWSAVTFYYLFSPLEVQIRTDESCLTHSRQVLGWTLEDQMFSLMLMSSKSLRRWLRLRINFPAQRKNPLLMVIQSRWWECLCPLSSLMDPLNIRFENEQGDRDQVQRQRRVRREDGAEIKQTVTCDETTLWYEHNMKCKSL